MVASIRLNGTDEVFPRERQGSRAAGTCIRSSKFPPAVNSIDLIILAGGEASRQLSMLVVNFRNHFFDSYFPSYSHKQITPINQ